VSREPDDMFRAALSAGKRVELVCLKSLYDVVRGRFLPHGPRVIVRTGRSKVMPVPGEVFTLDVERSWVFGHTDYAKGTITGTVLDPLRLDLPPLDLHDRGELDPEEEAWLYDEEPSPTHGLIRAAGPRRIYEMEQVMPEDAVDLRWDEGPILEAVELNAAGAGDEAEDLLGELLSIDLRCLDAHAHLGIFRFHGSWPGDLDLAERHFRVGVALGEMALGGRVLDFPDLLPWGFLNNRPFLRCFNGLGLCQWRSGDLAGADAVFRRLLWLSPSDNLGARFVLTALERGRSWEEAEADWNR